MNKIYNNLSIENLIKTNWFNQFLEDEQDEILLGLKANLDVSVYAITDFYASQMEQIRLGLEDNLDISKYANPEIDYEEMKKIRLKLQEKKRNGKQNIQ